MNLRIGSLLYLLLFSFLELPAQTIDTTGGNDHPKREMRGVWIATVENMDWPKKRWESADQQQKQLSSILDDHRKTGINVVFFQVRPAADAFYAKGREPWSKWLTGQQGRAPVPFYDPLAFAINEAHARGMELHAWFNPYRATNDAHFKTLSPKHITRLHPEWFFVFGGQKLFEPGIPAVREYIVKVILNVVDHYDIDGVHMDDYFYPYQVKRQRLRDGRIFKKYGKGFSNITDWRRHNVDLLIRMLGDSIHRHNPRIKYGISPFGIWANKYQHPEGSDTHGGDTYYELFADSRKWIREGWIDYIAPQLYRPLNDELVAFNILTDWWSRNSYGRHLYIGQPAYRIGEHKLAAFMQPGELPAQIRYLRREPRVQGSIFFSSSSLTDNLLGFTDSLRDNYYRFPALPPTMPWLDSIAPNPPQELTARSNSGGVMLSWKQPPSAPDGEPVYGYVIYRFNGTGQTDSLEAKHILHIQYGNDTSWLNMNVQKGDACSYRVTAIDRLKNESAGSNVIRVDSLQQPVEK